MGFKRKSGEPLNNYVKRYRKTQRRQRRRYAASGSTEIARVAKRVISRMTETKRKGNTDQGQGKVELYHNIVGTSNMWSYVLNQTASAAMPVQGNKYNERIGDSIDVLGWNCNLMLGCKHDRPNVTFRVIFYQRKMENQSVTSDPTYNTMMKGHSQNCLLDDIDTDNCRVLKEFTYKPPFRSLDVVHTSGVSYIQTDARWEYTKHFKMWIPSPQKKYNFLTDASYTHQNPLIWVAILVYDHYGSLSTDNIAYAQMMSEIVYKDS